MTRQNFAFDAGTTFKMTVSLGDRQPRTLHGHLIRFRVFDKNNTVVTSADSVFPVAKFREFDVVATSTDTAGWPKRCNYTVDLEAPDGTVSRLMFGSLEARGGVL